MAGIVEPVRRLARALPLVAVLAGALVPLPARADAVGDMADILDIVSFIPGIPVTGQDLRDSKKLFACIDKAKDDVAIAKCVDASLDTPVGQQAATQSGMPSWFPKLIEIYIDVRQKDWWGLVEDAGMTIACAGAQILTGVDMCGIAQVIIELVGSVKEAFEDVAEFLADIGCAFGAGCGPGTPGDVVAYRLVFEPRIGDGVKARRDVSASAFPKLQDQLEKNALAQPPKLSIPGTWPNNFSKSDVDKAAKAWISAVDQRWTDELIKSVLPARAKQQSGYGAQRIPELAAAAAAAYMANTKTANPAQFIIDTCAVTHFGEQFGYAHVDRWIKFYPDQAGKLPGLKSNPDWCAADLLGANVPVFAQYFRDHLNKTGICTSLGAGLLCQTLARYESCLGLMASVGQQKQCSASGPGVGKELADAINKHFIDIMHSKLGPCRIDLPDGGMPASAKPIALVCKRPTQQHFCNERLKLLWKHAVPPPLACASPELDRDYSTLAAQVRQAVTTLRATYPSVGVDAIDPLLVHAGKPEVYAKLSQGTGGPTAGEPPGGWKFRYQLTAALTIDGLARPTMVGDLTFEPVMGVVKPESTLGTAGMGPADPDPFLRAPGGSGRTPSGAGTTATPAMSPTARPDPFESKPFAPPTQSPERRAPTAGRSLPPPDAPASGSRREAVPEARQNALDGFRAPASQPQPTPSAGATTGRLKSPAPETAAATATTPATASAPSPAGRPVSPATFEGQLADPPCTADGARRYTCATRAAFERCEVLRQQRRVDQCTLQQRR